MNRVVESKLNGKCYKWGLTPFIILSLLLCLFLNNCSNPKNGISKKDKVSAPEKKFVAERRSKPAWVETKRAIKFSNLPNGIKTENGNLVSFNLVLLVNDNHSVEEIEKNHSHIMTILNDLGKKYDITFARFNFHDQEVLLKEINQQLGNELFSEIYVEGIGFAEHLE